MVNRNTAALRQRFVKNLSDAMQAKGMSQSDLARAVWNEERPDKNGHAQTVGKDRISAYVNGKVMPTAETLEKIARALDTTPEALLGEPLVNDAPSGSLQRLIAAIEKLTVAIEKLTRGGVPDGSRRHADLRGGSRVNEGLEALMASEFEEFKQHIVKEVKRLEAEGRLSLDEIAKAVGVSRGRAYEIIHTPDHSANAIAAPATNGPMRLREAGPPG
jgi:transcriptional regulator with XRE-family HTH domain